MATLLTMSVQATVEPMPGLSEVLHMPDLEGPLLKEMQKRVREKGEWADSHSDIERRLGAEGLSMGKWKAKMVSQRFKPGPKDDDKFVYHYEVRRRYELIQVVTTKDGKRLAQLVVAQCNLTATITRRDREVDGKYKPVNESVKLKYEWLGLGLEARPPVMTQVYHGWPQEGVEPPLVEVINNEKSYRARFGSFHAINKEKLEEIDFVKNQVVLACWGGKPATQYGLAVDPAYGTAKEIVVRIRTIVPYGIADPGGANPAVAVVIPRCERVKVIIGGDRDSGKWWKDFSEKKGTALEVLVP